MKSGDVPWPITYGWILLQVREYFDGRMDVQTLHLLTSDIADRSKMERQGQPPDDLKDALAFIWMRSQRVLRELNTESELRSLLLELLPDLEQGAAGEAELPRNQ